MSVRTWMVRSSRRSRYIGCTGGRHRSVCLANWLAERLRGQGYRVQASHRDLGRHAPVVEEAEKRSGGEKSATPAQQQTFDVSSVSPRRPDAGGGP